MTQKDETKGKTKSFRGLGKDSKSLSKDSESPNLAKLDELLDAWDDDEETSGVHIEEMHVHHSPTGQFPAFEAEAKTNPVNHPKPSLRPSISPRARNITIVIIAVATGLAGAMKILWEAWMALKK